MADFDSPFSILTNDQMTKMTADFISKRSNFVFNWRAQTILLSIHEIEVGLGSDVAVNVSSQVRAASVIVKKVLVV